MPRGIHLIGDLYGCKLDQFIQKEVELTGFVTDLSHYIVEAGLTVLGDASYFFGPGAVTVAFILAESHLSFHTWPENHYVSLDVFTCNLEKDNTSATEKIFEYCCREVFQSKEDNKQVIYR